MGFAFLENENLPESLRDKPQWVSCLAITSGILVLTMSAVMIGAMFGYTYCYIEHRGIKSGNNTDSNIQIVLPFSKTEVMSNRSINGAIMSSVFVSRIMKISHGLLDGTVIGCREEPSNETSQNDNEINATNEIETQ